MIAMKEIRDAVQRIVRKFHPQRVILFGSYARGDVTEDSDVDLLVIMPFEGKPLNKSVEVLLEADIRFPADILVRTPQMVRRRLTIGDCFMRDILEKGKVLYAGDHRRMGGQGRRRFRARRARVARAKTSRV